MTHGTTVQLDEKCSDPLSIYAGDRLVALGRAMVLDGKVCVKITRTIC
jgi:flagellar motor switch/type III secretory pathway protein FliN